MKELQADKNKKFWITTTEGTPEKRPNYKGTLKVSHFDGRTMREVELIWPGLFFVANDGQQSTFSQEATAVNCRK